MTSGIPAPVSLRPADLVARAWLRAGGQVVPLRFLPDLGRLATAAADEAGLTCEGRARLTESLVSQLVTQIMATRWQADHPPGAAAGRAAGRGPGPVFITGLHRTGTTLLQNLLAEHPAVRAPRLWELLAPASPAGSPRQRAVLIRAARRYVEEYYRAAPAFRQIHPLSALRPEECHRLTGVTFRADIYSLRYRIPGYTAWLTGQDMRPAYAYHRTLLDCLLARRPGRPVLLKCPSHVWHLAALAEIYPDARVVRLHRDPAACIASVCSLTATVRSARAHTVDTAEIGRYWLAQTARALCTPPPPGLPVLDLRHRDLLADPLGTAARVCSFAGISLTTAAERRMRRFLASNAGTGRHGHRYALPDYGLDPAELSGRFAAYRAEFQV